MAGPADSWQALAAATQPSQRDKRGQDLRGPPPARSARMEVTMNPIYSTAQLLAGLTVSACVVLTYAAAIPAALATPRPQPPGYYKHPPLPQTHARIHTVLTGGTPGWQIILIAAAAALLGAALAVLLNRIRAARLAATR